MTAAAPAHPASPNAIGGEAAPDPDGYIDFFGYSDRIGGVVFAGWIRNAALARGVLDTRQVRIDGRVPGSATYLTYTRDDIHAHGQGLLGFIDTAGVEIAGLTEVVIEAPKPAVLSNPGNRDPLPGSAAIDGARILLRGLPQSGASAFARALAQEPYEGVDTVARLNAAIHFEIDEVLIAPHAGVMVIGWFIDPASVVRSIQLCSNRAPPASLREQWLDVSRPDIADAFSVTLGSKPADAGFHAFAPVADFDPIGAYLRIELHDGSVAFKPLPAQTRSGRMAIIRALSDVHLTSENIPLGCAKVLGPTVIAISRRQLADDGALVEMVAGNPPTRPRCSIIVPLYGRIDFMMYQTALFSEHDAGLDEYIYVLDQPDLREEFIALARSSYRRFGVPIRLVMPRSSLGFAGASNAGLSVARGDYICFLNSDVMPKTAGGIGQLVAAMDTDPGIGLLGAQLLFEDGSIQHAGMELERNQQFGNLLFPVHPGKGRLPAAGSSVRDVPLVTGALIMMRRALALECGGFDTDYVIGDFEDADLCMQVRARGLRCAVHDGAQFYHFERQSQTRAVHRWRQNLTILNAWTFNTRWQSQLPANEASDMPAQIG